VAIKTRIWWDFSTQSYIVSSAFSVRLVEGLKFVVPVNERSFDPQTKFWYVKEAYGEMIREVSEKAFGKGSVSFTSRQVAEQSQQRTWQSGSRTGVLNVASSPIEDCILSFFRLLSYDSAKAAYRKAAMELHPDRANGDASKMSRLNEFWDRIEKEVFLK
jgi:hypothetical protein